MISIDLVATPKKQYNYNLRSYEVVPGEFNMESRYLIKNTYIEGFKNFLENNEIKNISLNNKVYFAKNATISRAKFREWARHQNIKVVLDPEKADIIVLDKTMGFPTPAIEKLSYVEDNNIDFDEKGVLIEKKSGHYKSDPNGELYQMFTTWSIMPFLNRGFDALLNISNNLNTKSYIDVNALINEMNDQEMDEEAYFNILNMLKSGDNQNVQVGLELLSNYNYNNSILYMTMLRSNVDFTRFNMTNVSLKPLQTFLNTTYTQYAYDFNQYISNINNGLKLAVQNNNVINYEFLEKDICNRFEKQGIKIDMIRIFRKEEIDLEKKNTEEKTKNLTITTF